MDDLTEIQITQQRINTICGLVEKVRHLYIKVGTLYTVGTVLNDTIIICIDNTTLEYPPLFASYEAAEGYMKSMAFNPNHRVVEMKLNKK